MRGSGLLAVVALAVVVACSGDDEQDCNDAGCPQGVEIGFVEFRAGAYRIEVDVDGETSTCTLALPASDLTGACSSAGVYLTGSTSVAPGIGGIALSRTDARRSRVRVARDGATIRDASFTPEYSVSPGPNGPGCAPEECRYATFTLP